MLSMQGQGEMRLLKPGKDVRDEVVVKTVLMRFEFKGVPLDVVAKGFIGQLSLFYSKDDDLKIGDLEYLPVSRHVSNVTATIVTKSDDVLIEKSIVDRVRIMPRPGRVADVLLDVKGDIVAGLDQLHDVLKTTVAVKLEEHEFEVAKDEREAA